MLLQAAILAQFLVDRNLYFALAFVAQTRAFDFYFAVGQFDLARLRTVPTDLAARLAWRALPGDLLRAQHENGLQCVDLDFVNHVLHHLAGAFDQIRPWATDLPVALTELLDHGGRFLGGTGHNLVWFLHGGWLLLRICVWQPDSIETGATAVTNLQLQMGHPPLEEATSLNTPDRPCRVSPCEPFKNVRIRLLPIPCDASSRLACHRNANGVA